MVARADNDINHKDGSAKSNADSTGALWLVKSGERILGPFRTDEIIEKVRTHELAVIDEISAPASRWHYLRDEPTFALVVEESRRSQLVTREDTEVQMGSLDGMKGAEITNSHALETMTLTPTHRMSATQSGASPHDQTARVQDAEFIDEVLRPGSATRPEDNVQGRQFGVANEKQMATSLERRSRLLWLFTLVLVIGIGVYLTHQSSNSSVSGAANGGANADSSGAKADNQEAFKQALSDGEQAWNHGDLEKALLSYRRADELLPGTPDVTVRLSALAMKMDGQTVAAKRNFQDLITKSADAGLQREAHLGLGMAAVLSEDYDEAKKEYDALLESSPNDVVVRYNLGVVSYLKGDFKSAITELNAASQIDSNVGPVVILAVLARIHLGGEHLKDAHALLESYVSTHFDYRQEGQTLESYLTLMRGSKMQAMALAGLAVGTDPFLTNEHLHDPWLDLDPISAVKLLTYVQKLQTDLKSSATQSLLAIFQAKAKQSGDAEKTIADGLAAKPSDADLLAANAFVLMQSGRDADAKAALTLARKDGANLAWILTGRNCQKLHEAACEKEAWDKLLQTDPPPLVALIGHAKLASLNGEKELAQQDLQKAEGLSPHYLPAIVLHEKITTP